MIKEKFLEAAVKKFGEGGILNRKQIKEIASSIGENDEEGIQVKENAKTGDLKRAFTKFAKSKTLNRQLLNKFIGQVA